MKFSAFCHGNWQSQVILAGTLRSLHSHDAQRLPHFRQRVGRFQQLLALVRRADHRAQPRFFSSRLKNFVLAHSFFTSFSPSGESSSVKAAWQAAAVAGGCEVENKNGRARKYKKSIRSREPQTYPPIAPIALLRVPT